MSNKGKKLARLGIVNVGGNYRFCVHRLIFKSCHKECDKICSSSTNLIRGRSGRYHYCWNKAVGCFCGECPSYGDCGELFRD